jgi:two-component system sensor histidine kinase KdpD
MDVISRPDIPARTAADTTQRATERDCLLVVINIAADEIELIRAAKSLAEALHLSWTVVNVQTSALRFMPERHRDRGLELTQLAESLGAETVTLNGASRARTIAGYARLRHATRILVSAPARFGWRALGQSAAASTLKRLLPGIEILAVVTTSKETRRAPHARAPRSIAGARGYVRDCVWGVTVTLICTIIAFPLAGRVDLINIAMIYLLGSAMAGLLLGRSSSALTAATNIVAFDYFFVPPLFSLQVLDLNYVTTFAAMLLVGLIIANLMIAVRSQTEAAGARERHTAALYAIARDLGVSRDAESMIATAVRHIGEVLQAPARVLMCDASGQVVVPVIPTLPTSSPVVNVALAQWVAVRQERAGHGSRHLPSERARYLPLRGLHATVGVLVVEGQDPGEGAPADHQRLLEGIADQLALALERVRLAELAHAANLAAERAAVRNTLLASISHDLRTPLSAIAGAGSIVAQGDFVLDLYRRVTLGRLIEDKARDMSDLLTNVLELVRLESGVDVLNRDWHSLSELVGIAIQRNESRLSGWQVVTNVPEDLPLLMVDANLIVQLLSNLLENAVKYTPQGTRIDLSARRESSVIRLVVEDSGPGLGIDAPDRLFEKFSRGRAEGNGGGIGLGLTICRTVARLHEGEIRAMAGQSGGARFEITLPCLKESAALNISPALA